MTRGRSGRSRRVPLGSSSRGVVSDLWHEAEQRARLGVERRGLRRLARGLQRVAPQKGEAARARVRRHRLVANRTRPGLGLLLPREEEGLQVLRGPSGAGEGLVDVIGPRGTRG
eukprot:6195665-Pleurochrysis_carterae.AAC.2